MKFAAMCLLGSAAAVRTDYSADSMRKAEKILESMARTIESAEDFYPERQSEWDQFERDMEAWVEEVGPKYVPEAEAWSQSAAYQAAYDHKMNKVLPSEEMRRIVFDTYHLISDFTEGTFDYGYGWNEDGSYSEWMDNRDLAAAFEDVYQIKEDVKAFVNSAVVANQDRLDWEAVQDPHFVKMMTMMMDDVNIHTADELEARSMEVLAGLKKRADCPVARRLKKQLCRLIKLIEHTKRVTDLPDEDVARRWWDRHDFQPWM